MNNNPMDNGTIDEDMEIIIEVDNLMMEMEIEIIIEEDQIIIINHKEEDHVGYLLVSLRFITVSFIFPRWWSI